MSEQQQMDELAKVVSQIDPTTMTESDVIEINRWGADKVGFVLVDIETQTILYATEGAEKIFGFVTDEMKGLKLIDLIPNEFKEMHISHVTAFGEAMQTRSMGRRDSPLLGKTRDGATFPVEIGLFPRKFKGRKVCLANVVRLDKQV